MCEQCDTYDRYTYVCMEYFTVSARDQTQRSLGKSSQKASFQTRTDEFSNLAAVYRALERLRIPYVVI